MTKIPIVFLSPHIQGATKQGSFPTFATAPKTVGQGLQKSSKTDSFYHIVGTNFQWAQHLN